ncbi:hypothetical protein BDD12DRAFT_725933 [Trichophaea hybrida]|nr:hypothetical protein BDD12DRAFT_725933 [Trichophaea hybrida]
MILTFYLLVNSATRWVVPGAEYFETNQPLNDLRFPSLYTSLSQVGSSGKRKWNHNIIFVAGNLTAASIVTGLACEMAQYRKNNVHIVFMGFDTLHLDAFRRINGLPGKDDLDGCTVYFHDARPEFAQHLTRNWQKIAVQSALQHINNFMHPQALIVAPKHEEEWFMDIVKEKSKELELVLIELPTDTTEDVNWIARLDSASLNAWHKPSFEVVIHANTHSGNLERLLKSLQSAYYPSPEHRPKRITIVLNPHISIHPSTHDFLRHYKFPCQHKLSIRRPIISKQDPLAATVKFVESFYTLSDHHSVLFLDPNTEVSKWYYHYLLFATLTYKYSSSQGPDTNSLFGISLELPSCYLDGRKPFLVESFNNTLFLYPSPASRAALFFAQHWCEFHSYVSHKLWHNPNAGSVTERIPLPC